MGRKCPALATSADALAWTYRRDYAEVRFPMLSVRDITGKRVAWWSLVNTLAVVVVGLLLVAGAAALLPAWRAGRSDPLQALRVE